MLDDEIAKSGQLIVPINTLLPDTSYRFSLKITTTNGPIPRSASTAVLILFLPGDPPLVFILPLMTKVNANDKVILVGSVSSQNEFPLTSTWSRPSCHGLKT